MIRTERLCASGGSLMRQNIAYDDPSSQPTDLMNQPSSLIVPSRVVTATLDATFGTATTLLNVVVMSPSQITSFTTELTNNNSTYEHTINLHALAGSEEVLSVDYTVEALDPQLSSDDYLAHDDQAVLFGVYAGMSSDYTPGLAPL